MINGLGGNDFIFTSGTANGGAGNDVITAAAMTGGLGADTFGFGGIIADFSRAQGDKINLTDLAATAAYIGYSAFSLAAATPEVRVAAGAGFQSVEIDINGDRVADYAMRVNGAAPLVASDFIL